MLKLVRTATVVAAVLVLAGCTSSRMTAISGPPQITHPQGDKATVVFYRSSGLGGAIQSSVFDVTTDPPTLSASSPPAWRSPTPQRPAGIASWW